MDISSVVYNSADASSIDSVRPRFLAPGRALWGPLESIEPAGDGLILVRVGGLDRLLPEDLASRLQSLLGKAVNIAHIGDRYGVGEMHAQPFSFSPEAV